MSVIPPKPARTLQFYLSGLMPCPYLPDQIERKLFTRLTDDDAINQEMSSSLTRAGFRRSHDVLYRPACPSCMACVPVRIAVKGFIHSRSFKRIMIRNKDLVFEKTEDLDDLSIYALFIQYQEARHTDGEMAQMTFQDFQVMLRDGQVGTSLYKLRERSGERNDGYILIDTVTDGYSAVYSFFRPDQPRRSLGIQLILSLIDLARQNHLSYVYLGYWIRNSKKMAYKSKFSQLQALGPQGWQPMTEK